MLGKLAGENSETYGAWLLVASAFFLGLPHGAYDFWILKDAARQENKTSGWLIKSLSIYLLTALFVVGIWYFLPFVALISFLGLTVWHFGSGDAVWENNGKRDLIFNSLGRGLLLIFAPLSFFPRESGKVLSELISNRNNELIVFLLDSSPYILTLGLLLVVINCIAFKPINTKVFSKGNLFILLETVLLLIFFFLTTPLLALTIYLVGVHSWRHILRLNLYENGKESIANKDLWRIIGGFHKRVLPITIVSLLGIGLIFWLWQFRISELANYTSAYLVLLSALTVPHSILITLSEYRFRRLSSISTQ